VSSLKNLPLESTGVPALDLILGGGLPAQSMTLIAGEPGSGKTIFTLQMLFAAARAGKKSLYFTTLSEPAVKVIRYMQTFDFFDAGLLDEQIRFVDLGTALRTGAEATLAELTAQIEEHEPVFVAIDSFRSVAELVGAPGVARPFVYDLANIMTGWGATTLLVGEYAQSEHSAFAEFAIADGIIRLGSQRQQLTSVRELEVLKLRGAGYVSGVHFFDIDRGGIRAYPRVRASDAMKKAVSLEERDAFGVAGLDELLDGGAPRGSSTVVQGGTGTGKTLLGLNFLVEGARRKERGILFTQEETPEQLRAIGGALGLGIAELEKEGLIQLHYTSPVELSTDRFLNDAQQLIRDFGARRAVFDSLTTMALGVPSERRFKELVYSITKHMRASDVSVLLTMEAEQLLGSANLSGLGVSFIADNLIQLRYFEIDGRLERAISVIKARGVKHESALRRASVGQGGLHVSHEGFKDLRGVLTGLPEPRKA
jgi:circadian clock protein KaiC